MQHSELETPIRDIVPHIFKRPVLSVSPKDSLLQVGTFLAVGPQIYVDGLVVLDGQKPVGRIGGQHIVQYILQHPEGWFQSTASQIMSQAPSAVEASDHLSVALDIFKKTRFAFVPVTIDGRIATSLYTGCSQNYSWQACHAGRRVVFQAGFSQIQHEH